jgi:molecular chaperone GrpE (heat shock protein)
MDEEVTQGPQGQSGEQPPAEAAVSPERAALEEALREKDQFKRLAQRAQADLVNYRQRVQTELEETRERAAQRVALKFIELADLMERALAPQAAQGVDSQWVEGVKAIYQGLLNVLAAEGFERFDATGEHFDPRRHDALLSTPTADHEPNRVIRQLTAGYVRNGNVVRPAQVEIAAPMPGAEGAAE